MTRPANEEEKKRAWKVCRAIGASHYCMGGGTVCSTCDVESEVAAALASYGDERAREAREAALAEAQAITREAVGKLAYQWGHRAWNDPKHPCLCWLCPHLRAILETTTQEPAPPKPEVFTVGEDGPEPSQPGDDDDDPAPKPANQCDGCARGLPYVNELGQHRDVSYDVIGSRGILTPCTADRSKESGR